ncbi:MAG: HD domain-containing protein [Candidatus Aenigmarchaeota archaeon]|nr:HD domain-containing protein [Candidatus Aenigmarchaeota archaeon]
MNIEKILEFMNIVENLKKTKRTGWIKNKIKNSESVADHSFRTALLALVLSDELNVDRDVMVKMALIHDIGECIIGDLTPDDKKRVEKYKMEKKAIEQLSKLSGDKEMLDLWLEFEKQEPLESQYIHQLDKLEMVIQALEYEKTQKVNLDSFFKNSKEHIKNPKLLEIFEAVEKRRNYK